jgi:hypothetical protein
MMTRANSSRESFHFRVYYVSLCLFAVSLPASRFLMTLSLIVMFANWLAEGDLGQKIRKFSANRPAIAFTLIYFISVVGLLWSEDVWYAFHNDLLHKLPTLFLPIVFVTSPVLKDKQIRLLLLSFISSVVIVSFIGFFYRVLQPEAGFRQASPFIPGIYFGIMLILAALQLPLLVRQTGNSKILLFSGIAISAWLIFFLFYLRALSGVLSFTGVLIFIAIILVERLNKITCKISAIALLLVLSVLAVIPVISIYRQTHSEPYTDFSTLDSFTESGNPYFHDTVDILRENGHPVYIYLADTELGQAWNERSSLDYEGNDLSGNPLRYTLYRYLSSKGLRKDRHDLMLLADNEIHAVENGTTNYRNLKRPGFYVRIYEEMMGLYIYNRTSHKDVSWGSVTKRIDLWRASWKAFRKKPLSGWGTGSILQAVGYGLEENGSPLSGLNMKPHSQYLYLMLTAGLPGLVVFLLLYTYVITGTGAWKQFMFVVFLIVFAINFFGNNSLESQPGQNLFVFFSLFYCFYYPRLNKNQEFIY